MKTKTHYLFGTECCDSYNDRGIGQLLEDAKEDMININTFEFIEGETRSECLAEAIIGYMEYIIITEEEYITLQP